LLEIPKAEAHCQSSAEVEYIALTEAAEEASWLSNLDLEICSKLNI